MVKIISAERTNFQDSWPHKDQPEFKAFAVQQELEVSNDKLVRLVQHAPQARKVWQDPLVPKGR